MTPCRTCFSLWFLLDFYVWQNHGLTPEQKRHNCARGSGFPAARRAFDLNGTFMPILSGEKFAELAPKVLSTDPWVVYFEKFLTEAEVQACELHLFSPSREGEFAASVAGGTGSHSARYSETAFCVGECDENDIIKTVRKKASDIVNVPVDNFDLSQALRYKTDEGLEGGETFFPNLNLTAPARRGAAVLFVNTKDRNPMESDARTLHESLPVAGGEKRGMNMWLYQYNYRHFWALGCTSISFADALGRMGKAAVTVSPKVVFLNHAKKASVHIFAKGWRNRGYQEHLDYEDAEYVGAVEPGGSFSVESAEGNVLLIRAKQVNGKLLMEHVVSAVQVQRVHIGKRPKAQQKQADEL